MAIILDIETTGHPCADEFIEKHEQPTPPDLDAITANKNLKDPVKIAESIEAKRAEAEAAYIAECAEVEACHARTLSRAALDWNLSRIVCIGWHESDHPEPTALLCRDEAEEREALARFWKALGQDQIIGFNARGFDVPTMIQRSRLLGMKPPNLSLARWGKGDVNDLRDALTFDDARYEALMPRTLKNFARRFGIPVPDPTNGKDVPDLIAAGDWEGVRSHCLSDLDLTRELAVRIGLVKSWAAVVA